MFGGGLDPFYREGIQKSVDEIISESFHIKVGDILVHELYEYRLKVTDLFEAREYYDATNTSYQINVSAFFPENLNGSYVQIAEHKLSEKDLKVWRLWSDTNEDL